LTDFVIDEIAKKGVKYIFGVTGGAVVHFFDSAAKHPDITPIFNHHEQASSFAAESYARVTNDLGVCIVTTGPGGTNAITGLAAAWLDSLPTLFISGQSRLEHTSRNKNVRQIGTQELDIIKLVSPITKYAVMIEDSKKIKYELHKAIEIATTGRPGPVWLDIPLNLQWSDIEPDCLPEYVYEKQNIRNIDKDIIKLNQMLIEAQRPIILLGYGIRLSKAEKKIEELLQYLRIPFLTTWAASELVDNQDVLYMGKPGMAGQRGANLSMQNCDLLIAIGSHLSISLTGTDISTFARKAKKVIVDIDGDEIKHSKVDFAIHCDAKHFLTSWQSSLPKTGQIMKWIEKCRVYSKYNKIPVEWQNKKDYINPYSFVDLLSERLDKNDTITVDGGGNVVYISFQGLTLKKGQRIVLSTGLCSMGSGLPECIGACFARDRKRTICLVGDGSMQLNIQELQTIMHHNLPIKIFVFNNAGYLSIRQTQDGFLQSSYIGSNDEGGMSLPNYLEIAKAYGINSTRFQKFSEIAKGLQGILDSKKPELCEIMISPKQEIIPRRDFVRREDGTFVPLPFEDLSPRLPRAEFRRLMVIEPLAISLEENGTD
jgi:acetolactate synthase-1/2/3 large subunit